MANEINACCRGGIPQPDFERSKALDSAEAQVRVRNGELNDFAPIMSLSNYLDDREDRLDQLRFADLTNYINIKNDTIIDARF